MSGIAWLAIAAAVAAVLYLMMRPSTAARLPADDGEAVDADGAATKPSGKFSFSLGF